MQKRLTSYPKIPFNIPYLSGKEQEYTKQALDSRSHCGNGTFSAKCIDLLKNKYGFGEVFLTPSCTSALEMGALLANIGVGDEVILPSYTFSSTANAIVLTGAKPVFCEIEPNTMNIDVSLIPSLITKNTKMIIPIDYAGIPCEIEEISRIAREYKITVMVDSAQSLQATYKGKFTGTQSDMAAFSFHETKNISCGEGGALIVNKKQWIERAHFLQEKGTDRKLVLDGVKTKYHWVDKGSSYLLADILAAMLLAQLESADFIVSQRAKITEAYQKLLTPFEERGFLKLPHPHSYVKVNSHAFFVIFDSSENRTNFLRLLKEKGVCAYIGYEPLHSSPMGAKFGYKPSDLPITQDIGSRIVRLPFYTDLASKGLDFCLEAIKQTLLEIYR